MNNILVSASNIHKSFGEVHAVNGVSLEIPAGEIYGLVGADGAGKTTTMRLLVGALLPDEGEVTICGYDVIRRTEHARSQIGYLSQRFSMYEDLTVLENIRFFAEVRGLSAGEWLPRSLEILEFVGLADFKDRRAGQLSGGMKQKLGLACRWPPGAPSATSLRSTWSVSASRWCWPTRTTCPCVRDTRRWRTSAASTASWTGRGSS
jgi:ABC-2 type transport system ATP-binding protein